jgi:glycosyltransferase involved in cell wall biosynthesis
MLTCVVIPHFDHFEQFRLMLPALVELGVPLIVVDDASPGQSFDSLDQLLVDQAPGSTLIRHNENTGKGGAVITGLKAALEAGYTHAFQVDADGQHNPDSIALLAETAIAHQDSIICGQPVYDESISSLRYYARYITLYFCWLETLSTDIRDAMCGFRCYPLKRLVALAEDSKPGMGMVFDPEILVRAVWAGIPLRFIPVHITYPETGKSHFHYFRDNLKISWMHTRLILGMLLRFPGLIRRHRTRNSEIGSS